jgi:hypothetical protein
VQPVYAYETPRVQAGDTNTADNFDCQLKAMDRAEYGVLGLSDAQFAQLQEVFPDGVCDYSKPGIDKQPTVAWQTYQDASGKMIVGGVKLPPAPANSRSGWNGPAFVY